MSLCAAGLSKRYQGVVALHEFALELRRGDAVALLGHNGSGKTTALGLMSGWTSPTAGVVRLDGEPAPQQRPWWFWQRGVRRTFQRTRAPEGCRALQYVAQGLLFSNPASVMDSIDAFLPTRSNIPQLDEVKTKAFLAMEALGVADCADRTVESLTHAQRRFLDVARATAALPSYLLLDEPGAGLVREEMQLLASLLNRLRARGDVALLVVDHVLELCRLTTARVVLLDAGTIVFSGAWGEFDADATVRRRYLGEDLHA